MLPGSVVQLKAFLATFVLRRCYLPMAHNAKRWLLWKAIEGEHYLL